MGGGSEFRWITLGGSELRRRNVELDDRIFKKLSLKYIFHVTTHFEKLRTLKKNFKVTKSTHFEIFFFSKCVIKGQINAL